MAEPETQTEDASSVEKINTEATDTDVTENATDGDQTSTTHRSTDYESDTNADNRKKRSWLNKGYAESRVKSKKNGARKAAMSNIARPVAKAVERTFLPHEFFSPGGFQLEQWTRKTVVSDPRRRGQIWRSMKTRQSQRTFRRTGRKSRNGSERLWPSAWPYFTRGAAIRLETREKEEQKRRRDIFPYNSPNDDKDEQRSNFASRKALGHARVPVSHPETRQKLLMDRGVGERPGLVDGDYVIVELLSRRVYAYVVLHGLKGMHLLEMDAIRQRKNTWKFCFFQAIVALLAKTQFRYKYAWSANIDYIYDHAWMLYTHIGTINVKTKQRLDDIVVYKYKFSVEIELVEEMKDLETRYVDTFHEEAKLRRNITLSRKDPLKVRVELGCQKVTDSGHMPVHKDAIILEEWLGKVLTANYSECILRTNRFSLAFWQDGFFWYIYNPYRCDKYGFWHGSGTACIAKFCSTDSLRRYLTILILRGHTYETEQSRFDNLSDLYQKNLHIDIQIFQVSFHYYQLDNPKLLQHGVSEQSRRVDKRPSDLLKIESRKGEIDEEEDEEDDRKEPRERAVWLKHYRMTTWGKCVSATGKKLDSAEGTATTKARWHQYYVEEPNRLFSLWGEIRIIDDLFDETNRIMQAYARYVICAGMVMITAPEYWSPKTLDTIVMYGNRYYTRSKHETELKSVSDEYASHPFKYLSDRFEIGKVLFETRMLPSVYGRLYGESSECLWRILKQVFSNYPFAILTCENACLGLFKFCGAYYMCDVNSFGPPLFRYGHGAMYLMRATSFRKFMMVLVLTIGSPERSRFSLNPIKILRIVEMDTAFESRGKTRHRFGKSVEKMPEKLSRFAFDGQKKRKMKKYKRNIIACNSRR